MSKHLRNPDARPFGTATFLLAALLFASETYAQRGADGAFAGLAGSWSGTGTITLSSGAKERIRCRATYSPAENGSLLQQSLRCASDSYNFDLRSNVKNEAGAISGTWRESTRQAQGSISGRASPGQIQANIQGPNFAASLLLATRGDRQSVSLRSQGSELSEVSIVLNRGT